MSLKLKFTSDYIDKIFRNYVNSSKIVELRKRTPIGQKKKIVVFLLQKRIVIPGTISEQSMLKPRRLIQV